MSRQNYNPNFHTYHGVVIQYITISEKHENSKRHLIRQTKHTQV